MKLLSRSILLVLISLLAGCSSHREAKRAQELVDSPMVVDAHYDEDIDFDQYKTLAWLPSQRRETGDPRLDDTAVASYLGSAISGEMFKRGYRKVTTEQSPDLYVNGNVAVQAITERYIEEQFDGFYEPGYHVDLPEDKQQKKTEWSEGTIFVFLFDAKTRQMIWSGSVQTEVDPTITTDEQKEERSKKAIAVLMESQPERSEVK
jgi:hypothetical protein